MSANSFDARSTLQVGDESYEIFRLDKVEGSARLPYSLKVLLENLLRTEDGANITADHIRALGGWDSQAQPSQEIQFTPARVIMQDFTGVPCVVDLATMREAVKELGGDPAKINPLAPAELVIDHSVIADKFGTHDAFAQNVELEYGRNQERYQFLRWGQTAFDEFKVVPPGTGIVHQVNIEHLARTVMVRDGQAYPDTLRRHRLAHHHGQRPRRARLGRRRHRGRGRDARPAGLHAHPARRRLQAHRRAARRHHRHRPGAHHHRDAAQARRRRQVRRVLRRGRRRHLARQPRHHRQHVAGVRLHRRDLPDRRRDHQATCKLTGRSEQQLALVEAYAKEQGLWLDPAAEPDFSEKLELDLSTVVPSIAGPKRPQDRIVLAERRRAVRARRAQLRRRDDDEAGKESFPASDAPAALQRRPDQARPPVTAPDGSTYEIDHGAVTVAAITSCTNTSNPYVMVAAALRGQEGRGEGPDPQAVGQDHPRPRLQGRHRLLRQGRPDPVPRQARLQPRRLRLHHLHRQLRPAAGGGLQGRQRRTTSPSPRCSPATATSRAGSTPTSR